MELSERCFVGELYSGASLSEDRVGISATISRTNETKTEMIFACVTLTIFAYKIYRIKFFENFEGRIDRKSVV